MTSARRSASECSHFRTRPSFSPYCKFEQFCSEEFVLVTLYGLKYVRNKYDDNDDDDDDDDDDNDELSTINNGKYATKFSCSLFRYFSRFCVFTLCRIYAYK